MSLSIVIPVWNNYDELNKCLASIAGQTILDWIKFPVEVIVVDDGSTDTENIKFFKNLIGRIQFHKVKHGGAPVARNFGFEQSTGELIFFCDSDVVFTAKDSLEKFIKTLRENKDRAYVYSSFRFGFKKMKCLDFDTELLRKNNFISTMSLIRRNALLKLEKPNNPFDESLQKFQDWDLWLSLFEKGEKGIGITEVLWRASGGTMSKWRPKIFYKIFKNNIKIKNFAKDQQIVQKKHHLL
jgi:hypothetical protein